MAERSTPTFPIVDLALANEQFRDVIKTGTKLQVVLMSIPEGEEIGAEAHEGHDQVLVFVQGTGKAVLGEEEREVGAGDLAFVTSGTYHNFINTGSGPLKLYTLYGPPEHPAGTEHATRAEAEADEHDH
ncbi:MAG: cupin domain-containing protein [Pseudomonadota bacterium]